MTAPEKKANMRVVVTKRMLKEGLLRCLRNKQLDQITISELCTEAGINRATFYKHYNTPYDLLCDIGMDYTVEIRSIYLRTVSEQQKGEKAAQLQCCEYLYRHKEELQILFSENADRYIGEFTKKYFERIWTEDTELKNRLNLEPVETKLAVTAFGWASYYVIRQWLVEDLDITPENMVSFIWKLQDGYASFKINRP